MKITTREGLDSLHTATLWRAFYEHANLKRQPNHKRPTFLRPEQESITRITTKYNSTGATKSCGLQFCGGKILCRCGTMNTDSEGSTDTREVHTDTDASSAPSQNFSVLWDLKLPEQASGWTHQLRCRPKCKSRGSSVNAREALLASPVLKSPYFSRVAAQSSDTLDAQAASGKTDNR